MGNVTGTDSGAITNTLAAGCSSDIDPSLFDRQRSQSLHQSKKHHLSAPTQKRQLQRRDSSYSTSSDKGIRIKSKKSKHRELDRRRGRANRKRRNSIVSIKSENDTKHSTHVIEQLISLGYGTEKECYQASALTRNYRDINDVLNKLKEIQSHTIKHPRDSKDKKMIQSIHNTLAKPPKIQTELINNKNKDEYLFLIVDNASDDAINTDNIYDDFKMNLDLALETSVSLENIKEHPILGVFAYSAPLVGKKPMRPRFELRNSISETKHGYFSGVEAKMKAEMRESIKSTLSEMDVLHSIQSNSDTDHKDSGVSIDTMEEPPLLPALPNNLKPWNDDNNNMSYVVCCTGHRMFHSGYKPGVYLYDLNEYNMEYLVSYPDNVYANCLSLAMDNDGDKLHLFGGKGLFGQWLILNLKAKLWDIRKDLSKYKMPFGLNMEHLKCIVIEGNLHFYSKGRFFGYNRRKHRFLELDGIVLNGVNIGNIEYMFYVKKQERIYVFGASNDGHGMHKKYYDNIWFYQHNKWYIMDITLPYNNVSTSEYDAMMAFEHILFVFNHKRKNVCCIDLVKEKSAMCDDVIVEGGIYSKIINTNSIIAHSLCMDHNGPTHVVIRLDDILASSSIAST